MPIYNPHALLCNICDLNNYPGVSTIDNYTIDKKLVCRSCLLYTLELVKQEKLLWYKKVKTILLRKLINNEPRLVDNIFDFLGISKEEDILKGHICSYCSNFMYDFHHNIEDTFYYYICGECL